MNWVEIINQVVLWVLPVALAYIFGRLGIDADKIAQHSRLLLMAQEAVLWAQDAFPTRPGVERMEGAYRAFVKALGDANLLAKVPEERRRQLLGAAYQEKIGTAKTLGN